MQCTKCSSQNVQISLVTTGGRTRKHGTGLGGNTNNAARGFMAITTLGVSNIFWKKSHGTSKHKTNQQKIALCQQCGTSWKIRNTPLSDMRALKDKLTGPQKQPPAPQQQGGTWGW